MVKNRFNSLVKKYKSEIIQTSGQEKMLLSLLKMIRQ
jgi:hypothetical protein